MPTSPGRQPKIGDSFVWCSAASSPGRPSPRSTGSEIARRRAIGACRARTGVVVARGAAHRARHWDEAMTAPKLLSRDDFREAVFARDGQRCAVCAAPAVDAHHVIERKLWFDGGYSFRMGLPSAATVTSRPSRPRFVRRPPAALWHHGGDAARSSEPRRILDKWGNPILPNGQRLRGELFDDEGVQKILAPVLHLFTTA